MNPCVLIFLGPQNAGNVTILGPFPNAASALAYAASTGSPWLWQVCTVYGPAIPPPMGTLSIISASEGSWLAIGSSISLDGTVVPIGFGTFSSDTAAAAWAVAVKQPGSYSFGQVMVPPAT